MAAALADVGPQEIHDTFLVAIENGPYAVYGPGHCRLEGLHHAEQHVGQGVLNSVVLIGYEGNGMEVAISVRTALQLEYSSLLNAARVIADAFGADVEVIKNRPDLPGTGPRGSPDRQPSP